MPLENVQVAADELRRFVGELFHCAGVTGRDANEVAASLVESNLRGHESHGVLRVVARTRVRAFLCKAALYYNAKPALLLPFALSTG